MRKKRAAPCRSCGVEPHLSPPYLSAQRTHTHHRHCRPSTHAMTHCTHLIVKPSNVAHDVAVDVGTAFLSVFQWLGCLWCKLAPRWRGFDSCRSVLPSITPRPPPTLHMCHRLSLIPWCKVAPRWRGFDSCRSVLPMSPRPPPTLHMSLTERVPVVGYLGATLHPGGVGSIPAAQVQLYCKSTAVVQTQWSLLSA